jgi:hypothetical protein
MKLLKMHEFIKDEDIILSFNGTITQTIVASLVESLEAEFLSANIEQRLIHSAFAVITEQMQNIMSYSKDKIQRDDKSFCSTGCVFVVYDKKIGKYYITSSNMIKTQEKSFLEEKIDFLNTLNNAELKEYYKEQRRSGRGKHERGAGLGFITMSRISSEPIEHETKDINENDSLFIIKVYL